MSINRINNTPVQLQSTLPTTRPTASDFAGKVSVGPSSSGGITAPFVPGGAIVSAAVSSNMTAGRGGAVSGQYQSNSAVGQMQADLDAAAAANQKLMATQQGGGTGTVNYAPGTGGGTVAQMQSDLIAAQAENGRLMQVQMQMQRENQVFSTVSNVLKVRHDTVKNTIQNVR